MSPHLFALWVITVFTGLWAFYAINPIRYSLQSGNLQTEAVAQAQWMSNYRDAVVSWAVANPGYTGPVNNNGLSLSDMTSTGIAVNQAGAWVMGPLSGRMVVVYAVLGSGALSSLDPSFGSVVGGNWLGQTLVVALPQGLINQMPPGAVASLTGLGGV